MSISRRSFLSSAAAGAVVASTHSVPGLLSRAAAASQSASNDNILVVLQLSGGNDGLNTVVPYADDVYNANRFTLRIGSDQVHRIDDYVGFHPAMDGMQKLYREERLAVIQGIGYPNPNRSHFESMDIWHTARQSPEGRHVGWLGRWFDATFSDQSAQADVPGVHLGTQSQPLALAGLQVHVPSVGSLEGFRLHGVDEGPLRTAIESAVAAPRAEADELLSFLQEASASALAASRRVQQAVEVSRTGAEYPPSDLGRRLRGVAQLIDAGLSTRIYYITLGGFDTHSRQGDAHAALLGELSEAVSAFLADVATCGHEDRVLLMCFSEFGRRVKENGSQGTDHGAAAPMFVAGSPVRAGLHGDHPSLTDLEDGDLKFHTDFRQVYASLLEDWLGTSSQPILGGEYEKLALLG